MHVLLSSILSCPCSSKVTIYLLNIAFPQAILQMAAIVIYKEANIIAIISILISMLSVASKSFVFSIATAMTMKQLFFNWLAGIADFFGIFFVVSWVFYEPNDIQLKPAFDVIQDVWLYRLYICTLPIIGVSSITGLVYWIGDQWDYTCSKNTFVILVGIFMWICGVIGTTLAAEILTWIWPALSLWILGTLRFEDTKATSEFLFTVIGWINSAKKHRVGSRYKGCTSFTKYQDKMMRLASFNVIALTDKKFKGRYDGDGSYDIKMGEYLDRERETQYMNVTWTGLRVNSSHPDWSSFWSTFWMWYGDIWGTVLGDWRVSKYDKEYIFYLITVGAVTWILGPIHLLSRMWTLFYPVWIIFYLYLKYDVNIWTTDKIDLFQVVMITIYIGLCSIIWVLFYFNLREQYVMHHLLPSKRFLLNNGKLTEQDSEELLKKITSHYYGIIVIPIRRAMVIEHFGPDLGPIILSYLPNKDEFESNENVKIVKTV